MPAVCPHFLRRKSACRAAIFVPICRYARAAEASLKAALCRKKDAALFAAAFLYPKKKAVLNAARQNFLPFATAHFPCIRICCGKRNCFSAGRWPAAVRFFARVLFRVLQRYYEGFTVVPVPPRPGKIKKTGWDQIADLCRYLRGLYGIRVCRALVRLGTQQQKKLSRSERLSRLGKQYALKSAFKKAACAQKLPHQVVLLDDIMTTGVTLETCAALLKEVGVQKVYALTLFAC